MKLKKDNYLNEETYLHGSLEGTDNGNHIAKEKEIVGLVKIISNQNRDAQSFMWQSLDEVPGETPKKKALLIKLKT